MTRPSLKLLFVNAVSDLTTTNPNYPIGLFYMLGNIKHMFGDQVECKFLYSDYERRLTEFDPHLVLVSSPSCGYGAALDCARKSRAQGKPVILGGRKQSTSSPTVKA